MTIYTMFINNIVSFLYLKLLTLTMSQSLQKLISILIFSFLFTGWLFDQTNSYTASFLLLGAVPLVTTLPRFLWDISRYLQGVHVVHYKLLSTE